MISGLSLSARRFTSVGSRQSLVNHFSVRVETMDRQRRLSGPSDIVTIFRGTQELPMKLSDVSSLRLSRVFKAS